MARHDPHGKEDLGERFSQFASVCGITDGHDLRSANDTPALNALKALRGAPISMGRGEIPVGCCQRPSGFVAFIKSKVIIGGSHAKKCNSFYAGWDLYRHLRDELGMSNEEIGKAGFDLDEFYEVEAADSAEYEVEADYGEEL